MGKVNFAWVLMPLLYAGNRYVHYNKFVVTSSSLLYHKLAIELDRIAPL